MDNQLYAEERKQSILELVEEKKRVQVSDLVELYGVTGSTIRNDLRELENEGLLRRTHGGAIKNDYQRSNEINPQTREFTKEKYAIAEKAVELIEENDTIAIDTGTSCVAFGEKLVQTDFHMLTILTYDLQIAMLLNEQTHYQVQVLGGVIRKGYPYVAGETVIDQLKGYAVDKVIMGTTFFDADFGFSTPNFGTAEQKRALMRTGKKKIVLCEASKFDQQSYRQFALPTDCDYLITDPSISNKQLKRLKEKEINVLLS